MATPGDVTFSGQITGCTQEGGQIGPVDIALLLKNQQYSVEHKDFPVAAGATIGGPGVVVALPALPAGLSQTLFVIKSDFEVTFQLNAAAPTYTIKAGAPFVMAGGFDVTQVEFGNAGGAAAKVYILQVVA